MRIVSDGGVGNVLGNISVDDELRLCKAMQLCNLFCRL